MGIDSEFQARFQCRENELKTLYLTLYHDESQFSQLLQVIREFYTVRPEQLKEIDRRRKAHPDWYKKNDLLGMMLYIDNFAGNIQGVKEKLDYFKRCGVNYLHLMPFLETVEGKSDGGYAVKDFRKVEPRLGTMEDLAQLSGACHDAGICLCMDFVMNHTSNEHEWALKARNGMKEYQDFYFFYEDDSIPSEFEKTVPQVFPTTAPGNFTYLKDIGKTVMTTFYPYQWDLNYQNPRVLLEMVKNLLFLVNQGIDVMRIDAVPYIWKKLHTSCRNLPEVHQIVRLLRLITEIVCPGVLLLGEVVMEPEKVMPYFGSADKPECHMLYNVTTMATIWHTVATRDARLLKRQLTLTSGINKDAVFLNYLRCHDDLGWGLDYASLKAEGMEETAHKQYLNQYFLGKAGYSSSCGELYNDDPVTRDARFCGTTASMCGIETALQKADEEALKKAVQLDVMLHAYLFAQSGIPVIYSGDEIAQLNDYSYKSDPGKKADSRYVHRGAFQWQRAVEIENKKSVEGSLFWRLNQLEKIRRSQVVFEADASVSQIETWDHSIIAMIREKAGQKLIGLFNFSEEEKIAWIDVNDGFYLDLINRKLVSLQAVKLSGYGFYYLKKIA